MKKAKQLLWILVVCMTLVVSVPVNAQAAGLPFLDVKSGDWYANAVTYVYEENLMSGLTVDEFGPADSLTRAMFVTILGRMDGVDTSKYQGESFKDVPEGQWFSAYVKWASQKGIVSGYTSDYFGANDRITREQMATMISRYLNIKGISPAYADNRTASFGDVALVSTWARKGVEVMRRTGIIRGNANGLFLPQNAANRAEAATVFMKLHQAIQSDNRNVEEMFVDANTIQEYKGNLYTVLDVDTDSNIRTTGKGYTTSLAVYKNYIYYTEEIGTGGGPTTLYRSDLNGKNETVIVKDLEAWCAFCIYDDRLYYTASTHNDEYFSRSIDLNTLQIKSEPYFYCFGTEDVWIVSTEYYGANKYCCYPGYSFIQGLPDGSDWTERGVAGVHGENMYYFMKYSIMTSSIYNKDNTVFAVGPYVEDYYVLGDGIYFTEYDDDYNDEMDDAYLHRYDLVTGEETLYDVSAFVYEGDMDWFYPVTETGGKLYFKEYLGENHALYGPYNIRLFEVNLQTGDITSLGMWFES